MHADPISHIQRLPPYGDIGPKEIWTLRVDQIHPVVRIAHAVDWTLSMSERIIFDYEFVWITYGQANIILDGTTHTLQTHDLVLIPPFTPHTFPKIDGSDNAHIAVHFDFAPDVPLLSDDVDERTPYEVRFPQGVRLPSLLSFGTGHRVERLLQDILAARTSKSPTSDLSVVYAMTGLILECLGRDDVPSDDITIRRNKTRVDRVLAHIGAHLSEPTSAEELANIAGISSSRLQTIFREATGYAVLDYLRHRRIDEARRLLADPDLPIKEIAARTGFEDSFHFSKVFRRIDGLSPSQYRAAILANVSPISEIDKR